MFTRKSCEKFVDIKKNFNPKLPIHHEYINNPNNPHILFRIQSFPPPAPISERERAPRQKRALIHLTAGGNTRLSLSRRKSHLQRFTYSPPKSYVGGARERKSVVASGRDKDVRIARYNELLPGILHRQWELRE